MSSVPQTPLRWLTIGLLGGAGFGRSRPRRVIAERDQSNTAGRLGAESADESAPRPGRGLSEESDR
ncbi:hypothetical protein BJ970_002697 [Saccharopolyspora phatthalungensis]|uniref:Uncharacterized protein n=1 Tax=Saccharopolyspora phatthalungensis TaxID=664693 RepID=A0A840QDV8_9PSEU|nr:hypothetical protein [Saccharopolyspora phatthalungensis]